MKQIDALLTDKLPKTPPIGKKLVIEFFGPKKQNRQGKFFVVSGPSGVGKNSLLNFALARLQGIYYLPSLTTRSLRPQESQGNPYYFITPAEFKAMIKENLFLEWKKIHNGNYYGTHLPTIIYALENGFDIVTDMDVLGCMDAVKIFPENIVSIFIAPPNLEELGDRLIKRDKDESITSKRLERVEMEMSHMPNYHHVIINDSLERAGEELTTIIQKYQI